MIAIIISACLASNPGSCKDYRIPLDEGIDANSCLLAAPPHLARWAEQHPGLVISRFSCRPAKENDT